MSRIRTKKKGYVYLLKSDKTLNGFNIYKYGCTTKTPEKRCIAINYAKRNNGVFSVIGFIESNNIFKTECEIKWKLWEIFAVEEYFICCEEDFELLVKPLFGIDK